MMFYHLANFTLLASLLAFCEAIDVTKQDEPFDFKPFPTSSRYEYAEHLAQCARTFHILVENCGDGKTDCPLLNDRTPPIPVSEIEKIIPPGATTLEKLMAFFDYNLDQKILNAMGYSDMRPSNDMYRETTIDRLYESDFDNATDNVWKCNRLNYRYLFLYEFLATGEFDRQLVLNSTKPTLADLYVNPLNDSDHINSGIERLLSDPNLKQSRWSPSKLADFLYSLDVHTYEGYNMANYDNIPYSKFYVFKSLLDIMWQMKDGGIGVLYRDTLLIKLQRKLWYLNNNPTVSNNVKIHVQEFADLINIKWAETTDINQRYHEFSKAYYEFSKLPGVEKHMARVFLFEGELGNLFYLNYFFGLPS